MSYQVPYQNPYWNSYYWYAITPSAYYWPQYQYPANPYYGMGQAYYPFQYQSYYTPAWGANSTQSNWYWPR